MDNNSKKGLVNLTKKATAIFGAALAALNGIENKSIISQPLENAESNNIQFKEIGKSRPMPVLKLNIANLDNSQFVASHASHRSHSSHYSHYSHRSGAMFS